MKATLIALLLQATFLATACAQERYTLTLMNGQELPVVEFNDSSYTDLQFTFDKNHFKRERMNHKARHRAGDLFNTDIRSPKAADVPVVLREGSRDRGEVFSVTGPDGQEKLFYYYSEEDGNYLTEASMRSFIAGQGDAHVAARGRGWLYAGLGVGAITGYAARGSVLAIAVPPLFALTTKIPTVRIRSHAISDKRYLHDEDYAAGFETQARSRYIRQALKGSAIGTVLGLAAYALIEGSL